MRVETGNSKSRIHSNADDIDGRMKVEGAGSLKAVLAGGERLKQAERSP